MCSIMGYCSRSAAFDVFKKGFDKTISRGPDDSRIVDTGDGFLGFHRLAIMGLRKAYEALPYFFPCLINFISMGFMNLGRYSIGAGISVIGFIRMIKEHLSASARVVLYVLLAVMSLILQYGWFMNYPITVG